MLSNDVDEAETDRTAKSGAPRGQKRPLRPREVWAIRARLEMLGQVRNLALLNLAIDSKLRGCDLVRLRVSDVSSAGSIRERAMIIQKKTSRPVQFEITKLTATSVAAFIHQENLSSTDYLFQSRQSASDHLSTRQYHRITTGFYTQAARLKNAANLPFPHPIPIIENTRSMSS